MHKVIFATIFHKLILMRQILSYPLSIIYYLCFGLTLVIFHVIQWVLWNCFGYRAHKISVDWMCFFLNLNTCILGTTYRFENLELIPSGVPLIIAANHQSFYDIPALAWYLRKFHVKFVSKIELGKGVPGISYNLRHGGSALIDRKDPRQALREIGKLGKYIEDTNRGAIIFPEGTRSVGGEHKEFARSGLKILCKTAPSAYVVPITINNAWKMTQWGTFPMGLGTKIVFTIHQPMAVSEMPFDELFEKTENLVRSHIKK